MAFVQKDRVLESTTVAGTGAATLLGAFAGYQSFGSVMSVGDTCPYAIVQAGFAWETGLGTYSGTNTLTRTTVYEFSNGGAAVSFGVGTKTVFLGLPASQAVMKSFPVALASTLSVNGATIGASAFAVNGNSVLGGTLAVQLTSASALAVQNGSGVTALQVDASTALMAAGLKITGSVTSGLVAIAVVDIGGGSNTNLGIDGKGTGQVIIGANSTGAVVLGTAGGVSIPNATASTSTTTGALKVSGGSGVAGTSYANQFIANQNTSVTADTSTLGSALGQFVAADGALAVVLIDSYGTQGLIGSRYAGGTKASKTAAATGVTAFSFGAQAWDGTGFFTGAAMDFVTAGNWSGTSHGFDINWRTAASGSTTLTQRMSLHASGGLYLGSAATDPGSGCMAISGTTASTSTTTGALTVAGGVGLSGDLYVGSGTVIGAPTGGNKGAGTVNISGAYYANGVAVSGTGTVTSITGGYGLPGGTITGSGTLAASLTTASNVLGADVTMGSANTDFTGPSMAQGTTGTWLVVGKITLVDTASNVFIVKLTDGTTVYDTAFTRGNITAPQAPTVLHAIVTNPAGNMRMLAQNNGTGGTIKFNASGQSKDSSIYGVRIA